MMIIMMMLMMMMTTRGDGMMPGGEVEEGAMGRMGKQEEGEADDNDHDHDSEGKEDILRRGTG